MAVYLARWGDDGPVKIGTANDAQQRVRDLQTASPVTISIIRIIDGGQPQEHALHVHFAHLRIRGEWFTFSPEMLTCLPPESSIKAESKAYGMALLRETRGMLTKVAVGLNLSRSAVSQWQKVPGERVVEIERASGIPRARLRPDLFRAEAA